MNKTDNALTLENIGKLLDQKLEEKLSEKLDEKFSEFRLEMNDRFREMNQDMDNQFEHVDGRLNGIDDRLSAQGERIRKLERGMVSMKNLIYQKIGDVKVEMSTLRGEMNDRFEDTDARFDEVLEKIQEFIGVTDKSEDKKIKVLKETLEPRIEKLEHKFKFSQV